MAIALSRLFIALSPWKPPTFQPSALAVAQTPEDPSASPCSIGSGARRKYRADPVQEAAHLRLDDELIMCAGYAHDPIPARTSNRGGLDTEGAFRGRPLNTLTGESLFSAIKVLLHSASYACYSDAHSVSVKVSIRQLRAQVNCALRPEMPHFRWLMSGISGPLRGANALVTSRLWIYWAGAACAESGWLIQY